MDAETTLALAKAIANATTGVKNLGDGDRVGAAASFAAAGQNVLQELVKAWGSETAKAMLKVKPTLVLENAIAMTGLVELINGWSVPEKGSVLTDASKLSFELALVKLKAAAPDPQQWSGKAALAYGEVNREIQECLKSVMKADGELKGWVQEQSEQVLYTRRAFSYTKAGLVACLPVAWAIYLNTLSALSSNPYTAGIALLGALKATRVFQYGVSVGALGTLIGFASDHMVNVSSMSKYGSVTNQYDAARSSLPMPTTTAPQHAAPTSSGTTFRGFRSPSGAGGNVPATAARAYPVAGSKAYPVAGGRRVDEDHAAKEPVHALAPTTPDTPSQPATPDTPVTPSAVSAAGSMTQTAGQAIQGAVSQATNALKQTVASDEKATVDERAHGTKAAGAEAAAGADGAERAPIDAALSSEQAHEPNSAQAHPVNPSARSTR